jgi:outer membrane biogenesis lipoprotein LolB
MIHKEGEKDGRSRSAMTGDGQSNQMSCICRVLSSAHQSHLLVNTSRKSKRRGAAFAAQLACVWQPAVWHISALSIHNRGAQYGRYKAHPKFSITRDIFRLTAVFWWGQSVVTKSLHSHNPLFHSTGQIRQQHQLLTTADGNSYQDASTRTWEKF